MLPILFTTQKLGKTVVIALATRTSKKPKNFRKKGLRGNCQFILTVDVQEIIFHHTLFIWKASDKIWKVKQKKKRSKKKSVTNVHWSGTQDFKLWELVCFSKEKKILAKPFFLRTIALCLVYLPQIKTLVFLFCFFSQIRKIQGFFFYYKKKKNKKKFFFTLNCIFFLSFS